MDIPFDISIIQPPDVSLTATLILLGVSFIGALIMAMTSIGGGFVMAALAQVLPPIALIPIHGVSQLGSNVARGIALIKYVQWKSLPPYMLGSLIGCSAGAYLFVQIDSSVLQLIIGISILTTVFITLPPLNAKHLLATGLISGFLAMFVGAMATFVSGVLKGLNLEPAGHVSTHATMTAFQHAIKIVLFGAIGFTYGPYIPFLIAMIGCSIIGTLIGKQFLLAAGAKYFRPVLNVILVILAGRLIWTGIEGIMAGTPA